MQVLNEMVEHSQAIVFICRLVVDMCNSWGAGKNSSLEVSVLAFKARE